MKLKLEDLIPQYAEIKLSTMTETLVIKPWSLKVRFHVLKKYGQERLQEILATQSLEEICEIIFFMMTDESKALFKDFESFTEKVLTTQDILAITMALLKSIGLSEPAVEELRSQLKESEPAPSPKANPVTKKKKT